MTQSQCVRRSVRSRIRHAAVARLSNDLCKRLCLQVAAFLNSAVLLLAGRQSHWHALDALYVAFCDRLVACAATIDKGRFRAVVYTLQPFDTVFNSISGCCNSLLNTNLMIKRICLIVKRGLI